MYLTPSLWVVISQPGRSVHLTAKKELDPEPSRVNLRDQYIFGQDHKLNELRHALV
jgi:hypothetical protein